MNLEEHKHEDSIIERLLVEELKIANKHLPVKRKTLKELLMESFPCVVLRDGSIHYFRREELYRLKDLLEESEWDKLLLPIVISMRPDIGEGAAIVESGIASKVVSRILGIEYKEPLIIYRPHIAILREKFDTIFQFTLSITATVSEELEEHTYRMHYSWVIP